MAHKLNLLKGLYQVCAQQRSDLFLSSVSGVVFPLRVQISGKRASRCNMPARARLAVTKEV